MATRTVNVRLSYENGRTIWSLSAGGSTGNRLQMIQGDTLQINLNSVGAPGASLTVSNFSGSYWTATGNLVITSSGSRTTKSSVATPASIGLVLTASGGGTSGTRTLYIEIVSGDDIVPDAFDLGDNVVGARLGGNYYTKTVAVSGITVGVLASITAGTLVVNNQDRGSSYTVYAGDTVQVGITASSLYTTTISTQLNIGGVTDSWAVTTQNDPASGELIPFPVTSLPISLSQVCNFFGGLSTVAYELGPKNILSYLRGGQYVPNIAANTGIPTTAPIRLSQFIGSATSFFMLYSPPYKRVSVSTVQGPAEAWITWAVGTDYDVGFGPGMRNSCEYRYGDLVEYTGARFSQGVTLVGSGSLNPAVYAPGNKIISITVSSPQMQDAMYEGKLTVYIRLLWDTSKVITATLHYRIYFYGP